MINLNTQQKRVINQVINVFETGTARGRYDIVAVLSDGPGKSKQISYGRSQTNEASGLKNLLEDYVYAGGMFSANIRPYLSRIGKGVLHANEDFKSLLATCGKADLCMVRTQDKFFEERYLHPALHWSAGYGFTKALSGLVIYDSFIHSGTVPMFLRRRFPEAVPANGGDEKTWIKEYVATRHSWLKNHDTPLLRQTIYRTECLGQEIDRENWDLLATIRTQGAYIAGAATGIVA